MSSPNLERLRISHTNISSWRKHASFACQRMKRWRSYHNFASQVQAFPPKPKAMNSPIASPKRFNAYISQPPSIFVSRPYLRQASTATYSLRGDIPAPPPNNASSDISFGSYKIGIPPKKSQLLKADSYFTNSKAKPHLLMLSPKFRNFPVSDVPEVVFLGRSNVGKSSLLNALLEKNIEELAKTSKHPGHTKTLNAYGINGVSEHKYTPPEKMGPGMPGPKYKRWAGAGGLVVVDTPGYGSASRLEWGEEIMKYLTQRKQLRRAFLLIEAEHGLKDNDFQILRLLNDNGVPHQIVFVKSDKVFKTKDPDGTIEKLLGKSERIRKSAVEAQDPEGKGKRARLYADIIFTSTKLHWPLVANPSQRKKVGIAGLRWEVLNACGYSNESALSGDIVMQTPSVEEKASMDHPNGAVESRETDSAAHESDYAESLEDAATGQESRPQGRLRRGTRRGSLLKGIARS